MPADNVFKKFACDTGKGYRSVIYCLQLAAFFENRCNISSCPVYR